MNLAPYLDSTYLKTTQEAKLTETETLSHIEQLTIEAIEYSFVCAMIRPNYVSFAKEIKDRKNAQVHIGTVIDFPLGKNSIQEKNKEAQSTILSGADELDYVLNYNALLENNWKLIEQEFKICTDFCLKQNKIIKWIIEVAALEDDHIKKCCNAFSEWSLQEFPTHLNSIYLKSSTGYFPATGSKPSGATLENIRIMLEYGDPLPIKASGGIKTEDQALSFIDLGVKRIGTSSALKIFMASK